MCLICKRNTPSVSKFYNELKEISRSFDGCPDLITITKEMLPANLEILDCSGSPKLTSIESIPKSLRMLDCNNCFNLLTIKGLRDSKLTSLTCRDNHNLSKIISLPETLICFICNGCPNLRNLTVDNTLPESLISLQCRTCLRLENIPILPKNLEDLSVPFHSDSKGTLMPWLEDCPKKLDSLSFSDKTFWRNKKTKELEFMYKNDDYHNPGLYIRF